jgi:hypothetical protein
MTFNVLKDFEAETPSGTLTLKEGQKVKLSKDEAILLIKEGFLQPVERMAYRVYSEILEGYLWVVETDKDMHSLRGQGISEAVYTADDIKKLNGLSKESLKEIHKVKETFKNSKVEEVKPRGSSERE